MFEAHSGSDFHVRRHLLQGTLAINKNYFLLLKVEPPFVRMDVKACHCCKLIAADSSQRKLKRKNNRLHLYGWGFLLWT